MMENSITKFCISASIFLILISLSMNFVLALGVFPTEMSSPVIDQSLVNATGEMVGSGDIFSFLGISIASIFSVTVSLEVVGLAGVVWYAVRTGSFNLVAVYLFGMIFWDSWFGNLTLLGFNNYITDYPVIASLMLMITVVMVFIFAGATIGILGGND
jgi:hypothetical protein